MPRNGIEPLRVGLVGCGWVAEVCHLPAFGDIREAKVVAVADMDRDRAERMASRYGIARCYGDFRALLDDPQVEAVAVCVPSRSHFEVGMAAIDAGKHLFLEKPLTANLDECDRLIERASGVSTKAMVGFSMRWHRLVRQARRIITSGELDPIHSMRTVFTSDAVFHPNVPEWKKKRALGGGALIDQAIHHFDLWRFLLQTEVEQVFATSATGQWEDETASVAARMANGVIVSSMFSAASSNDNEVEVCGRGGRLRLSAYRFDGLEFFATSDSPGSARARLRKAALTLRELRHGIAGLRRGGEFMSAYRNMWQHYAHAIRNDAPVECPLPDARRTLQLLLAIVESSSRGQPVAVAEASRTITPIRL